MTTADRPSRLARITVYPRRDFRFWLSVAAFGAMLIVGASVWSLITVNRHLTVQVDENGDVSECRSAAAVFTDTVGAQGDVILNLGLAAFASGRDLAPYTEALTIAGRNYDVALRARTDAVERCTADPTYRINPSILAPVPPIPDLEGS